MCAAYEMPTKVSTHNKAWTNIVPGTAPLFETIDRKLIPHGFQSQSQFQGHRILAETRVTVVNPTKNWIITEFQFSSLGICHKVTGFQQHAQRIEGGFFPNPTMALNKLNEVLCGEGKPFDNYSTKTDGCRQLGLATPVMQAHLIEYFGMLQPADAEDENDDEDLTDEAYMNDNFGVHNVQE